MNLPTIKLLKQHNLKEVQNTKQKRLHEFIMNERITLNYVISEETSITRKNYSMVNLLVEWVMNGVLWAIVGRH